jgi:hypothetical protein
MGKNYIEILKGRKTDTFLVFTGKDQLIKYLQPCRRTVPARELQNLPERI